MLIRNGESLQLPLNSGDPQSSVLRPFLFLVYINDVDTCCTNCFITKFAEDIKILANTNLSSDSLQITVNNIVSLASAWLLNIHLNKCSVLYFDRSNPMTN